MAEEAKAAEAAEEKPAKQRGSLLDNKLAVIGAIVALQGGMAFAAAKFLIAPRFAPPAPAATAGHEAGHGAEGEHAEGAAEAGARGPLVSLDEMVVSLNAPGRPRYLRTNIALEARDAKIATEIEESRARFRDVAIMRLSSYSPQDIETYQGKEAVKTEIKTALKSVLEEGDLLNVYFSDFVVQ